MLKHGGLYGLPRYWLVLSIFSNAANRVARHKNVSAAAIWPVAPAQTPPASSAIAATIKSPLSCWVMLHLIHRKVAIFQAHAEKRDAQAIRNGDRHDLHPRRLQ